MLARHLLSEVSRGGILAADSKIETHPLGFLCFRWQLSGNRTLRMHLWSRKFMWRQVPDWQIHDHVFSFHSSVIQGELLNKCYESASLTSLPIRTYPLYAVTYGGTGSNLQNSGVLINIRVTSIEKIQAGSQYSVAKEILHRTRLISDSAISLLAATAPDLNLSPRVIGAHGAGHQTFSRSAKNLETCKIASEFLKKI